MATDASEGKSGIAARELKQDRLVEKLIPDPAMHEPAVHLTGWLGKSAQEGTWRLYLSPQLDEYVQIPESAVLHSEPLDATQSPAGGTMVWLKADTPLEHTQVVIRNVLADFLSGDITDRYIQGSALSFAAARMPVAVPTNTRGYQCSINRHIPACQDRTDQCGTIGTVGIGCGPGTGAFVCGQTVGCSVGKECSVGC